MSYKVPRWEVEISHSGLGKHEVVRDRDRYVAERKAQAKLDRWDEIWRKKQEIENRKLHKEANIQEAEMMTQQNLEELKSLDLILAHTLDINDAVDWDSLLDDRIYKGQEPKRPLPAFRKNKPFREDIRYNEKLSILEKLIPALARKKTKALDDWYQRELQEYENAEINADKLDKKNNEIYEKQYKKHTENKEAFERACR